MIKATAPHHYDRDCLDLQDDGGCIWCCETCNIDRHVCKGCGDNLTHLGNNHDGTEHKGCTD